MFERPFEAVLTWRGKVVARASVQTPVVSGPGELSFGPAVFTLEDSQEFDHVMLDVASVLVPVSGTVRRSEGAVSVAEVRLRVFGTRTARLTPTEMRLVEDLAISGARDIDLAARFGMSQSTVKTHLGRIYSKLGVNRRAALVSWWFKNHAEQSPDA